MPVSNLWSAEKREPFPAELVLWGPCAQEPRSREIKRKTLWALQSYRATIFLSTAHKSFLLPIWCSTWINPKVGLVCCRFTSKPPTCYGHSFAVVLFTCCKSCRPGKNLFPVTPTWFHSLRHLIQVSESVPQFLNTCVNPGLGAILAWSTATRVLFAGAREKCGDGACVSAAGLLTHCTLLTSVLGSFSWVTYCLVFPQSQAVLMLNCGSVCRSGEDQWLSRWEIDRIFLI